jgi:predicted amidohydrolase YtcJ
VYWSAGYQIHVHVTGDLGVDLLLDIVEKLQHEHPRVNHRLTLEHFGLSTPEQAHRIAQLGVLVSANPYYLYELSGMYSRHGVGYERASQMSRLGSLVREGVPVALHSDFTMAPALPLTNAWIAANRINSEGNVMAPDERLTLDQALRAITIDAAYILNKENRLGSLRSGKIADMTVLEQDPYEIGIENLKDVEVWGTVFEGEVHPCQH